MKVLILHLGSIAECLAASSIIRGIKDNYNQEPEVTVVVANKDNQSVFKYNKYVRNVYTFRSLHPDIFDINFDYLVNLHDDADADIVESFQADEKYGFFTRNNDNQYFYNIFRNNKRTRLNIFQLYYKLANLKWEGQRYDFHYKPRTKSQKKRTGLAVANANLRNYIIDKLKLDQSKLWLMPYKKNIFKRTDEINRCKHIVTDDFLTMNLALYLQKKIFFLKTLPYGYRLDMFGNGKVFKVPPNVLK